MSPDIMPGPAPAASAVAQPGSAATGPPGNSALSVLFASVLAHSSGPPAKTGAEPDLRAGSVPAAKGLAEKSSPKPAPGAIPSFPQPALPIKRNPLQLNPMRPTCPPTAGVAVETQNAMDTLPVSGPRKAQASETKPGGELLLPEARTTPSAAFPAFPLLLIPVPTPAVTSLRLPAAAPAVVTATAKTATAKPGKVPPPVALPSLSSPEPAAPYLAGLASTFTLPVVALPQAVGAQPVAAGNRAENRPETPQAGDRVASLSVVPPVVPYAALPTTYRVTAQVLPVAAEAVAAPAPPNGGRATPKAAALTVLGVRITAVPARTLGPTAPRVTTASAGRPAVTVRASSPVNLPGNPAALQKAAPAGTSPAQSAADDWAPGRFTPEMVTARGGAAPATAKLPLKSLPALADNYTGTAGVRLAEERKPLPTPSRPALTTQSAESLPKDVTTKDAAAEGTATPVFAQPLRATNPAPSMITPAPLTRAERAAVIRQVADGVAAAPPPARPGTPSQMTLQLHPKDWGQLQVSVRITPASGSDAARPQTVTAHVVAGSAGIKTALENGSSDLRHALRQAGLHLDRLTVTVSAPTAAGKSGTASGGGHHLMNGGGGQGQPDGRPPGGNSPQPGASSFAAFAGSQNGRQNGPPPQAQTSASAPSATDGEEAAMKQEAPRRPASSQIDMRA